MNKIFQVLLFCLFDKSIYIEKKRSKLLYRMLYVQRMDRFDGKKGQL